MCTLYSQLHATSNDRYSYRLSSKYSGTKSNYFTLIGHQESWNYFLMRMALRLTWPMHTLDTPDIG